MRAFLVLFSFLCSSITSAAQSASAGLIEAGHPTLRSDLQWLKGRGVLAIDTTSWPLPVAELERAVDAARTRNLGVADEHALQSVKRALRRNQRGVSGDLLVTLHNRRTESMSLEAPNRAKHEASIALSGSYGRVAGRLALNGYQTRLTNRQDTTSLEGSYLAGNLGNQLLYAGQINHAWGPGQVGSLIWSNAASPIPGIGIKRATETTVDYPVLKYLGDWGYEIFAGELQNATDVPGTKALAMRLHLQPLPGLWLGASRMVHWGGSIGENNLSAIWKAFVSGNRNANFDASGGPVSNEIAGFDASWDTQLFANPMILYGQIIGEDEAGRLPYKFIALAGVNYSFATSTGRWSANLEYADTMTDRIFGESKPNVAYTHGFYTDGMYHEGLPIAHFIGGDGKVGALGLEYIPFSGEGNFRYRARLMHTETHTGSSNINLAWPDSKKFKQVDFNLFWRTELNNRTVIETMVGLGLRDDSTNSSRVLGTLRLNIQI